MEMVTIPVEDTSHISDGYHTFGELYAHRIELWIALCRELSRTSGKDADITKVPWRSLKHSDGSRLEGWFVLGVGMEAGRQMTYHVPFSRWQDTGFAQTWEKAPTFDGHTAADVLERLKTL